MPRKATNTQAVNTTRALETAIPEVFQMLHSSRCPDPATGLLIILNMHKTPIVDGPKGLIFGAGTSEQRLIEMSADQMRFFKRHLLDRFHVNCHESVLQAVRHQWTHYLPSPRRVSMGQYHTPANLSKMAEDVVRPLLDSMPEACVFDPAVGMGALLQPFKGHRLVGWDIDQTAVLIMKEMGFTNVGHGNSLVNVSRKTFGIGDDEKLIIVGNPPYNDGSSQHKRQLKTSTPNTAAICDADIQARDVGMSFMLAAAKLDPEAICLIHPASYLIKESNFKLLHQFSAKYRLEMGLLCSSEEFGLRGTPFPVVVALYKSGKMDYAHIEQFEFEVYRNTGGVLLDSGDRLKLANLETTKGFIRNLPPKAGIATISDLGIYQFNFRDANYVITSATLTTKPSASTIPVQFSELGKYAYLNCFRRYFGKDFVFGNLNPLVRKHDFQIPDIVDAFIYDTIMNSQNLAPFSRANPTSVVVTKGILASAQAKADQFSGQGVNPHSAFVNFWTSGQSANALSQLITHYFSQLKASSLINKPTALVTVAAQLHAASTV
jgi:hypothetical protein